MRVGFDISQIIYPGGVANYTRNLALNLQKEKSLEMVFFFSSLRKKYSGDLKNVKKYKLPPSLFEILFNRIRSVGIEKFIGPVDIFHSSDWVQPPSRAKKVTTYHDVIPLKFPKWSNPKIVAVHKRRLKIVEREIDMVIAVSETTKNDLLSISSIPKEKIVVIPEGVEERFKPQKEDDIQEFKKKYNLPEKFILAFGGIGERKNLKRIKEGTKDYHLVVPGQTIPILPDEEMPLLYASAQLLIYVPLYEGFGLPIIEAMAVGIPFIVTDATWSREIIDYSALFANPESIPEIQEKLKESFDPDTREYLVKEGLRRSKDFTWEETARQTTKVYVNLVNK